MEPIPWRPPRELHLLTEHLDMCPALPVRAPRENKTDTILPPNGLTAQTGRQKGCKQTGKG